MNRCGGRAGPLRKGRNVVPEGGVVGFVNKDSQKGGGLLVRVGLELGAKSENKCGNDHRK